VPRLFIIDGAKALSKAIRRTFGRAAAIQRCQIHKARNIMERLPKSLHASVRCVLRQAWELDDAAKAERLLRNLAQRLEREWSGVAGSILEGIDEISPSRGLDCQRSCGARSPVPTSSRMP
jgi:putative transposase